MLVAVGAEVTVTVAEASMLRSEKMEKTMSLGYMLAEESCLVGSSMRVLNCRNLWQLEGIYPRGVGQFDVYV